VPDELWEAVQEIACDRDETVTDVILRALRRYVRTYGDASEE
jgi:predicted transcriptional regulator